MKKLIILFFAGCFLIFIASCGGNEGGKEAEKDSESNAETSNDEAAEKDDEAPDEETTVSDNENGESGEAEEVTETPDSAETETPSENISENSVTEEEIESNFAGTWAQKIIFRSQSSATFAKNVPSVTTRYLVVEIRRNENGEFDFFKKGDRICRTMCPIVRWEKLTADTLSGSTEITNCAVQRWTILRLNLWLQIKTILGSLTMMRTDILLSR